MKARSIEWGVSWNPVKGQCPHPCFDKYCYMKAYFKRFNLDPTLRLDEEVLAHPPKAERIFVCSSLDLFAKEIPDEWIKRVLSKAFDYPDRDFFFLTKKPLRYRDWHGFWDGNPAGIYASMPRKVFCGTSWDGLAFTHRNVHKLVVAAPAWARLLVSFEPLLAEPSIFDLADIHYLDWVIIGADSGPGAAKPPKEWADRIIDRAGEFGIAVFVKSNYGYPEVIQEYPKREE